MCNRNTPCSSWNHRFEVQIEVDQRRNLVRATAMGTTELKRREGESKEHSLQDCLQSAARSMRVETAAVELAAQTSGFYVFTGEQIAPSFWGLFKSRKPLLRVTDRTGVIRLQRGRARVSETSLASLKEELTRAVEALTDYGDAGRTIPDVFILYGARLANFAGLAELEQLQALVEVELRSLEPTTPLVVIACPKQL